MESALDSARLRQPQNKSVTPAKAGVQLIEALDSGLRRNDKANVHSGSCAPGSPNVGPLATISVAM